MNAPLKLLYIRDPPSAQLAVSTSFQVCIYNWPGLATARNSAERWAMTDEHFSPGTHLGVIEPYYKLMADGMHGIRIDNPETDLMWLASLATLDASGYRDQAKEHFRCDLVPPLFVC
jgi:hypothetical protein